MIESEFQNLRNTVKEQGQDGRRGHVEAVEKVDEIKSTK